MCPDQCALINRLSEVVADPQVIARGAVRTQEHPVAGSFRSVAPPWRLGSQADGNVPNRPAPLLGEHGRSILSEIGLDDAQVDELAEAGVVWLP